MKNTKKLAKMMLFISTVCIILTFTSSVFAKEYSDLSSGHWAYGPINTMSENGILNGYPDGSFKPDVAINRAEFAKIIVLTLDLTQKTDIKFEDVPSEYWASEYINVASNYLSAYKGDSKYYYKPEEVAVREDVAVAVVNAAGLYNKSYSLSTLDRFSDKDLISENLKKYVAIAIENGLMRGNANGTFDPKGNLTRAQVAQLMINSIEVLEKISIYDESMKYTFPKFSYNESTGIIDLGENWNSYKYSYSEKKDTIGSLYTPSQRYISYNGYSNVNENRENNRFCGNYVYVVDKYNTKNFVSIKVTDPFRRIEYDAKEGQIDLGANWKKFEYSYTNNSSMGTVYMPAQRVLTYSNYSERDGKVQETFCGNYVYIYIKDNHESYTRFTLSEPSELPEFEYDEEDGTIDLGANWQNYKFSYSTRNSIGSIYTPSQRILSYNRHSDVNENKENSRFCGNYVFIMQADDLNNYTTIEVTNPFEKVSYDKEVGQIDLGTDWEKFEYSYTNNSSMGTVYVPAQRFLTYSNYSEKGRNVQETFCGNYAYVYLANNPASYTSFVLSEPTKMPKLEYDEITGRIDLGAGWRGYKFMYYDEKFDSIDGELYTPSQRFLTYNMQTYFDAYDAFVGKYVYVVDKYNYNRFARVDIKEPFIDVKYDEYTDTIDLGANWKNYSYGYGLTYDACGQIYTPAQRTLTYEWDDGTKNTKNMSTFCSNYVYVYLKANTDSYRYVYIPNSQIKDASIRALNGMGIISFYPDGTFREKNSVNEAEAIKFIVNLYKKMDVAESKNYSFSGVSSSHWAYKYYGYAHEAGWLNGIKSYSPDNTITISTFLKILLNSMGYDEMTLKKYGPIPIAASNIGLLDGKTDLLNSARGTSQMGPGFNLTLDRETAALILYNALDTAMWGMIEEKVPTTNGSGETIYQTLVTFGEKETIREEYWK